MSASAAIAPWPEFPALGLVVPVSGPDTICNVQKRQRLDLVLLANDTLKLGRGGRPVLTGTAVSHGNGGSPG